MTKKNKQKWGLSLQEEKRPVFQNNLKNCVLQISVHWFGGQSTRRKEAVSCIGNSTISEIHAHKFWGTGSIILFTPSEACQLSRLFF